MYFSDISLAALYRLWPFWRPLIFRVHAFSEHFSCRIVACCYLFVTIRDWVSENLMVLSDRVCTEKNHTGMVAAMVGQPARLRTIENLAERSSGGHLAKPLSQSGITTAAPSSIPSSTWSLNTSKGGDPTASPRVQNRQPGPVLIYPPCEQTLFFRCNQNFPSLNLLPLVCNNTIVFVYAGFVMQCL